LSLREIVDRRIPVKNRVALFEDLPLGVFDTGAQGLEQQLRDCLQLSTEPEIWVAIVRFLARERRMEWLESLNQLIAKDPDWVTETFCARMAVGLLELEHRNPGWAEDARLRMLEVAESNRGTRASEILRNVLAELPGPIDLAT
jgi:hypothetical protein